MKIDRSKLRKAQSELPLNCQQLIQKLKEANDEETVEILKGIQTWHFGKCELFHWIDVLDKFDTVLASVSKHAEGSEWILVYDQLHLKDKEQARKSKETITHILKFTGLLVEHSYARHIYSSMEHLIALLSASDMEVVLSVLNVLYIFSKRSNFISRLPVEQRKTLHQRLYCLAESWGGVENGFGLAQCSKDIPPEQFPESASNVHFEFYSDVKKGDDRSKMFGAVMPDDVCALTVVHLEGIHKLTESPGEIMEKVLKKHRIPDDKRIKLFSRIRLAKHFYYYAKRIKCLQARLQAISILVYSTSNQENTVNQLLYPGFVEEIVDAIRLNDLNSRYADISSASLRTLTAIIHLERNSRLNSIIEATGANSYHGFLPTLVRNCIQAMTDSRMISYSHGFATALFSFLYHLASYESGGEALVSCGLMESLLKVIEWYGEEDCITFVTRAVRVVDLITNLDMAGFQNHGGLTIVLNRLEREIKLCQPYHGGILSSDATVASPAESNGSTEAMETSPPAATAPRDASLGSGGESLMDTDGAGPSASTSEGHTSAMDIDDSKLCARDGPSSSHDFTKHSKSQIIPQRAALLKSILNFLKKAILDPSVSDSVRTVMDGSLPTSLKYIISNVEYYGPALYLLATDVVTVYVFHEPSLLSSLQDKDLTGVVLKSLIVKDIPATREVLAFLPNILSALCLNNRGLQAFMACKPFDKLFKVLLSPDYLPAMRRRRSSDSLGDTASSLGTAMDELMRHQPTLKTDAMKAIIKLLEEVCQIGSDPKVTCVKSSKNEPNSQAPAHDDEPVSDEDEYDEDRLPVCKVDSKEKVPEEQDSTSESVADKKKFVPLTDYILNVVKFVDAILSNNSTDDHCREFVRQKGLEPLIKILGLPNLPLDFPTSSACQAVGTVGRSILVLCQEHQLLQQGLHQLTGILKTLEPLNNSLTQSGQSLLLQEIIKTPKPFAAMNSYQQTPLLHAMAATQSYVNMFTYICRAGQNDLRTVCINHWGADLGIETLKKLCHLYSALVWESSVLLVLCTQENLPGECDLLKKDLQKLSDLLDDDGMNESASVDAQTSSGSEEPSSSCDSEKLKAKSSAKLRLLKQQLAASSKLGRSLAEFFSLLVRLAVGSGQRQRRLQHIVAPSMPTIPGRLIASQLAQLLMHGLSWKEPEKCPLPRLNLTFYICSLGFVHPMLFDDRKNPYHLMLQQLVTSGGHHALFDRFQWVVSCGDDPAFGGGSVEDPALPEGSDEFLNAWLALMEKLVNPKLIMESPHALPAGEGGVANGSAFQPRVFLTSTQKRAFSSVMSLWDRKPLKTYGTHMKQSLLSILCHIIQGEKLMKANEKTANGETPGASSSTAGHLPGTADDSQDVNEEHLQQLVDMGFTRQHARNALLNTATIEQATEYVLTRAHAPTSGNQQLGLSFDMSEEDQMMQAIALSLGESIAMSVDRPSSSTTGQPKSDDSVENDQTSPKDAEEVETLDSLIIDKFAENMMPGCLALVSELPEAVYKACDLIVAVAGRNGKEWRDRVIGEILSKVRDAAGSLCDLYEAVDFKNENPGEQMARLCEKPEANLLKSMLHLLSLVLEEMKSACACLIMESGILERLVRLLRITQKCLCDLKATRAEPTTPSWLTPLLLLVDLYERSVEVHLRKLAHDKCTGNVWKWFDDRSGRWHNYSNGNSNTIDGAYRAGESSIRFTAGRRRYVVHLDTMIQVNEDSGNRRPIMLEVITNTHVDNEKDKKEDQKEKNASSSDETPTTTGKESKENPIPEETSQLLRMPDEQKEYLVRSCVALLAVPVESSALNAVVRLCVRLTRDSRLAQVFVDCGGPHHILELKRSSMFDGFALLITLLLRHVVEDQATLRHTMEKVIRSAAVSGIGSLDCGVGSNSLGTKEIHYILRVLSPAATRHPELFKELVLKTLRFSLPAQVRRGGPAGNEITIPPGQALLVNTLPVDKPAKLPKVSESVRSVVYELLQSLCRDPDSSKTAESVSSQTQEPSCYTQNSSEGESQSQSQSHGQVGRTLGELGDLLDGRPTPSLVRHLTGESLASEDIEDMIIDGESSSSQNSPRENKEKSKDSGNKDKVDNDSKPLLNKNTIIGMLSELVKSYSGVAQLIAEYEVQKPLNQVRSQISILAFIMDYLLPSDHSKGVADTSHRARQLLTVMAACNHSPDAQAILVSEIKDSLARALAMPESLLKHTRLQALFQLVLGIIDSGCSSHQQNSNTAAQQNNTIKLFIKKGIVSDLARVSQSLDLSSPNMVTTVNCLLKPLEKLSNLVNLPTPANASAATAEKKEGTSDGLLSTTPATSLRSRPTESTHLRNQENHVGTDRPREGIREERMMNTLDPGGLHIEGRAVQRELEDTYMAGSEEGESEARSTAESGAVAGEPELDSERVAESDEDLITSPSLDAVVIEIRDVSNESSVDNVDESRGSGGNDEEPSGIEVEVDGHDEDEDEEDEDEDDEEDEEDEDDEGDVDDEEDDEDHRSIVEDEELEAEGHMGNGTEEGGDEGVVVESYNGVIMLEDEGEESEGEDRDEDDDDEDDEEDGSEIEGNDRGLGDHDHGNGNESDYLFLQLDEPRQGSISRLIREHAHPGAILASHASPFRGNLFTGIRSSSAASTSPSFDFSVEHPLLSRHQSTERTSTSSRVSRVRVLRSDRNRRGHMTHIHVHYPHELARMGGRLLLDDDIRLISRSGHRSFGGEDFTDIFADGAPSSNILSDISSALYLWTQESQILDGGSVHHCVASVKKDVLPVLEKDLEEQIGGLRETERKKRKDEEAKLAAEASKKEKGKAKEECKSSETKDEATTPASTEPMQVESSGGSSSLQAQSSTDTEQNVAESASTVVEERESVVDSRSMSLHNSESVTEGETNEEATGMSSSAPEAPSVSDTASCQPREVHVESSHAVANETPTIPHPVVPPIVFASRVPSAAEQSSFFTPNLGETPPLVCPNAPGRLIGELLTPVIPTPPLPQSVSPTMPSFRSQTPQESMETGDATAVIQGSTSTAVSEVAAAPVATGRSEETPPAGNETPGTSGESRPATIDGVLIPEGVDPSFLEALPEAIRREVLAEQLALRPTPSVAPAPSTSVGGDTAGTLNVSPEFLAALPPDVQDEVLQQQRLEQERQRVRTLTPEEPVDPGAFLRNLPPSLRQQILTDMDDSQFSVLPEDLSTQAQSLRREFEARQARMMQERFAFGDSDAASAISALLRRSGFPRRVGRIGRGGGLQFSRLLPHPSGWDRGPGFASASGFGKEKKNAMTGRQILDNEALVCLLILLFVDEPRLNVNRLHKVIRNFCYHEETRLWVIQSLISILRRTSGQNPDGSCIQGVTSHVRGKGPGKKSEAKSTSRTLEDQLGNEGRSSSDLQSHVHSSWLNMSVDAALGCRAQIFNIQKSGKSTSDRCAANVSINSQAASLVCKHIVDALASLAKHFPASFTPVQVKTEPGCTEKRSCSGTSDKASNAGSDTSSDFAANSQSETEFWNILVRLDGTYGGKKGKLSSKQTSSSAVAKSSDFNTAPIGYLMTLLSHPVIRKNASLMDSLLRLLSVVSMSLPDIPDQSKGSGSNVTAPTLTTSVDSSSATMSSNESQSAAGVGRARTPESVTSSLVVETSPRGLEPEPETENIGFLEGDNVDGGPVPHETVNEPMDVEIATQATASIDDDRIQDGGSPLSSNTVEEGTNSSSVVMAPQLRLAVEVLTSGACSEDGLEDATTLLLQVSRLNADTRDAVLLLLLMGVRQLGHVLQEHIAHLLEELRKYNATHATITPSEQTQKEPLEQVLAFQRLNRPVPSVSPAARLFVEQRFGTGTGSRGARRRNPSQQRHIRSLTYDLHLPAMASLTEKTSSQNLFLRGLRVILQLRVAARKAALAAKRQEEKRREQEAKDAALKRASPNKNSDEAAEKDAEVKGRSNDDEAGPSQGKETQDSKNKQDVLPRLSSQLALEELWDTLSECLSELARTSDRNAVLVLQPAVEAFFLVHGTEKEDTTSSTPQPSRGRSAELSRLASIRSIDDMPPSPGGPLSPTLPTSFLADLPVDQQIFLRFAEMHQTVLNHILRQSTTHLADGPFAVLVDHTRFLDFDIKRRYFRQELERLNEGAMRRDDLSMHVRREHVFEDSYRELHRRSPEDLKSRLYVVFEGEEGQDAGGLLREWFMIMSREMFNPNYALFRVSPGDRVTYLPNPSSHCNSNHLSYFKFVGRVVAKAIYDNKLLDAYFTRSFYKHILGTPVKVSDMEAEDYSFYQGLVYLLEHDIDEIGVELTFSTEIEEFGVSEIRDLKPNGRNIPVTEDNKKEYVKLICQEKMTGSIRKQIESFLEGFYEIIPKRLISIFDEQELELLISGLPTIDLDDLKANTEYHKYNENSLQIQWLWRALRSFDQADRAKFLQFVTGTSKVPLQGFAALEGMNGLQKFQIHRDDRSTDRLPAAHTCFNQLDLPAYETYDKLRSVLLKTIHECPEGFGLA